MAKKKVVVTQKSEELNKPLSAGIVKDSLDNLIGKYIYLTKGQEAEYESFCECWLKTYAQDERFFLTIDLETTGLDYYNPDFHILLVSVSWDGHNALVFQPKDFDPAPFIKVLETIPISNQNIKFDAKCIRAIYGVWINIFFDTMVACQMGFAGVFPRGSYSLDNIVSRILPGLKISKATRNTFIGKDVNSEYTREQIEYAASDSLVTHKLVYPLIKRLYNHGMLELWETTERPLLNVLAQSEYTGVLIDVETLKNVYNTKKEQLGKDLIAIRKYLTSYDLKGTRIATADEFNPNSVQQLNDALKLTGNSLPNTTKAELEAAIARKPNKFLELIIDYRKLMAEVTKQMKAFLEEHIDYNTNLIHPTFYSCGTDTGRSSCSEPNMQQVPPALRSIVIARPGKMIFKGDYSSYEFRACAALTGEEYLVEAYNIRKDLLQPIKDLAAKFGERDPDDFVKGVGKGKFNLETDADKQLVLRFLNTDVHRLNAASVQHIKVEEVTEGLRQIGKCVSLESYVHTSTGLIKLSKLLPKKIKPDTYYDIKEIKVLTDEGPKPCTQIYYNGPSEAVEITTRKGRKIVCSPKHRFRSLVKNKYDWKFASDIKIGTPLFLEINDGFEGKNKLSKEYFELLGHCIHFGTITENKIEFFNQRNVAKLLEKLDIKSKLVKNVLTIENSELLDHIQNHRTYFESINTQLVAAFLRGCFLRLNESTHIIKLPKREDYNFYSSLFLRLGMNPWLETSCLGPHCVMTWGSDQDLITKIIEDKFEKLESKERDLEFYYRILPDSLKSKVSDYRLNNLYTKESPTEILHSALDKCEFTNTIKSHNIICDTVVGVRTLKDVPMADLSVPDNHTVVYDGFVCHNTLGYTILYGGGADKIQESLSKEKIYHTLDECNELKEAFYRKANKIKEFTKQVKEAVIRPGYLDTLMGRRRFFYLGPKWRLTEFRKNKQDAERQAGNYPFQASNADAIKMAMIEIYNTCLDLYPEDLRPLLLLNVHDELVYELAEEFAEAQASLIEQIMIKCGSKALGDKIPIECSTAVAKSWQK